MTTTIEKLTNLSSVHLGLKLAAVTLCSSQLLAVAPVKVEKTETDNNDMKFNIYGTISISVNVIVAKQTKYL